MAEHHPPIPAAPGYFARLKTPDDKHARQRVVAWTWDGEYGWPIVEAPTLGCHAPAIVAVMEMESNDYGWTYKGAVHVSPIEAVLPARWKNEGTWVARYNAHDGHGELELDVVAWAFRGGSATAIVVDPGASDGEYDHVLVEADHLADVLDWDLIGVGPT